ncbi:MAG: hypothetical protein AAF270_09285 [Pseudomonadota bacterium]
MAQILSASAGARAMLLAMLALWLTACGGGSSDPAAAQSSTAQDPDLQLAKAAYSTEQRTPAGFYSEPTRFPGFSEYRFHVLNADVGVATTDPLAWEMCSDDSAEALQWSGVSASARQFQSTLSGTDETEWFFEFERSVDNDPQAMLINRVFKCAVLRRDGLSAQGYAGQLTKPAFNADDLKFVSEYLWQFSLYNNALHAVVSSEPGVDGDDLTHTLERVEVRTGQGAVNGCDRIELWHWVYAADLASGLLSSEQRFVRAFDARSQNGVVDLCQP